MGVFSLLRISVQSVLMKQLGSLSSILVNLWMTGNSHRQNIHTVTRQEILPAFWQLGTVKRRRSSGREDGKTIQSEVTARAERSGLKSPSRREKWSCSLLIVHSAERLALCIPPLRVPVIQPVSSSAEQRPASGPPSAACPLPTPLLPHLLHTLAVWLLVLIAELQGKVHSSSSLSFVIPPPLPHSPF